MLPLLDLLALPPSFLTSTLPRSMDKPFFLESVDSVSLQ